MKSKIGAIAVAGLVVAAVGYFAWNSYLSPNAKAIGQVRAYLNDPDSAMFGNVGFFSKSQGACGTVNAKNRMGGYVGFTEFIVEKDGEVTFRPTADTEAGSLEDRSEALKQQIAFLELKKSQCSEDQR